MTDFLAGSGSDTHSPVELFAGECEIVTQTDILSSGENLAKWTVVGRDSTTKKLEVWDTSASDGTQTPVGILVHAVDASLAEKTCQIYVGGFFNFAALVVPGSITTAALANAAFDRTPIRIGDLTNSVG